jgi:hypothetical protein
VTTATRRRLDPAMSRVHLDRMRSRLPLTVVAAGLLAGLAAATASAQEVIKTGPDGAPPAAAHVAPMAEPGADPEQSPEAIGAWGRRVLEGRPAPREQAMAGPADGRQTPGCTPPPDRRPHGEVWAGAGAGGYRDVGGVVSQPLGNCGSVTLMIDKSHADDRWRGR